MSTQSTTDGTHWSTLLLWIQGLYYLITGIWPLLSIESFQRVTGPKTDHLVTGRESDHWLVMTVAVLITAIALSLLCGAWRRRCSSEVVVLAVGAAVALTVIDVIYVLRGVLSKIYLADAAAEIVLLCAWAGVWIRQQRQSSVSKRQFA